MNDGFNVFKIWLGLKLHFTTETYDWFKYDGRVNCKLETFTKRNDRYFFYKLGTKYNEKEIINYFVANFLSDTKKWIGDLSRKDGHDQYLSWKKYNENLDYHFRSDCVLVADRLSADSLRFNDGFSVDMGQHPRVLRLLLARKINFETAIILDKHLSFIKNWDKEIAENIVWPVLSKKLKKYRPFVRFNSTSTKLIMKEVFLNEKA